ncbi:hypothetical protein [Streptomyces sp. NPDC056308]|uniref:hypothetical protein n=1 Tax=Streptomyces sp. NPDC056308 TaxID=3345780 RepID=UPI0035D96DFD
MRCLDKQVEESAESIALGIGRSLAGRLLRGERKTDAMFWNSGTRVLPKVEGRVSRSSYRAGWQRLTFRISGLAATGGAGYWALWENQDATFATAQDIWENPAPALTTLETGGIAAASATAVGGLAYGLLTRKRHEFMREWVRPLHEALAVPLGMSELTDPRRYLHVPRNFSDDDAEIRRRTRAPAVQRGPGGRPHRQEARPGERLLHLAPRGQGHARHRQEAAGPAPRCCACPILGCARSWRRCPSQLR